MALQTGYQIEWPAVTALGELCRSEASRIPPFALGGIVAAVGGNRRAIDRATTETGAW